MIAFLCNECIRAAVVMFCHSTTKIKARFLFRAQDHNMTNGDFAFFTLNLFRSSTTDKLWTDWSRYADDSDDLQRRQRAFYVVKQVYSYNTRHL